MTALSAQQTARLECLKAARELIAPRNVMGAGAVDAIDLVNIALFIESGEDPYALQPVMGAGVNTDDTATAVLE